MMKHFGCSILIAFFGLNTVYGDAFWPNGAQLVITINMNFESGGQPEGALSPWSDTPMSKGYVNLPAATWWAYGYKEGIERMLDLWDKHNIKVSSYVVGEAALKNPKLAKAIADRGHELVAHGIRWVDGEYKMSYKEETKFIKDGIDAIEKITGFKPLGYNAWWLLRSKNTLKICQDLGLIYHVDDVSRDVPFVTMVREQKFAVVPYTVRNNDIVQVELNHFSAEQFLSELKLEFDQLYEEGSTKRRMMMVALHDRIGGTPAMVQAIDQFIQYAKQHSGVVFMRRDEIAKVVLNEKDPLIDNTEIEYNK